MHDCLKRVFINILPEAIIRHVPFIYKKYVFLADIAAAKAFKRDFFWNAFKTLDFNGIDGDYVEFGSHGGLTFRLAYDQIRARQTSRHMWAFDSFQGLPNASSPKDVHPRWKQGTMSTNIVSFNKICKKHGIPNKSYSVVPGFYDKTLIQKPHDSAPTNIALAYIDCDMYSSTTMVLSFLLPRLKHGMIIAFDDYFCYSAEHISGERRALLEVFKNELRWNLVPYRNYGWAGASFIVERADINDTNPRS